MAEVPKIVREKLRGDGVSGAGPRTHPDANLLAAFAEQALSAPEREQVLAHLASCEDCRTVVALGLPPLEHVAPQETGEAATVPSERKQGWFSRPILGWPTLRWGALAAGVAMAAALLAHYGGSSNPGENANKVALSKQAAPEAKSAEAVTPAPPTALKTETSATYRPTPERDRLQADEKSRADAGSKLEEHAAQNKPVVKTKDLEVSQDSLAKKQQLASAAPAAKDKLAGEDGARQAGASSTYDTVEVNGATGAVVQAEKSFANEKAPSDGGQIQTQARNEVKLDGGKEAARPITRAKSANAAEQEPQMTMQLARGASEPATPGSNFSSARWTLSAGMLRRSTDSGASWQTTLMNGNLLCYAPRGAEIWAGGKSGLLFHSTDNGVTWAQAHASVGDRSLGDDVIRLELRGAAGVVLSTGKGETWTSPDDGKNWSVRQTPSLIFPR